MKSIYIVDCNRELARVLEEKDESGKTIVSYTYGNELISQKRSSVINYYLTDGIGSVRLLTDSKGAITDTYTYDAFGNVINKTGTTINEFLFTGEQYDANLGFYYLRARYMNPKNGRFVTMDTWKGSIFEPETLHRYLYCKSDPVNNIDPSGKFFASFAVSAAIPLSSIMFTHIGFAVITCGILDAFLKPGYAMRYGAIDLVGDANFGDAAMDLYEHSGKLIEMGCNLITFTSNVMSVLQVTTSLSQGVAKIVTAANSIQAFVMGTGVAFNIADLIANAEKMRISGNELINAAKGTDLSTEKSAFLRGLSNEYVKGILTVFKLIAGIFTKYD
jgi:RHS repeat-associated protein